MLTIKNDDLLIINYDKSIQFFVLVIILYYIRNKVKRNRDLCIYFDETV